MSDDSDWRGLLPAPGPGEYWGSDHVALAETRSSNTFGGQGGHTHIRSRVSSTAHADGG